MTSSASTTPSDSLSERMSNLVQSLAERLVDDPASMRIESEDAEGATTLRLYVAPDELGKVIGKQGRTVRSLRTVLSAIAGKSNHRMQLDVLESGEGDSPDA